MKKATLYQRLETREARTDDEKIKVWQKMGFSKEEATGMTNGATINETTKKLGGVWTVGTVPFPQAISAPHAIKLYIWNFGPLKDGDVRLLHNDCYVIDTYIL